MLFIIIFSFYIKNLDFKSFYKFYQIIKHEFRNKSFYLLNQKNYYEIKRTNNKNKNIFLYKIISILKTKNCVFFHNFFRSIFSRLIYILSTFEYNFFKKRYNIYNEIMKIKKNFYFFEKFKL